MAAEETNVNTQQDQAGKPGEAPAAPVVDYDKLAGILAGRQAANEESVLKGYFKQQGLTGDEMNQAIAAFKAEKAKNTPDPAALQQQVAQANARQMQAEMSNHALLMASELGVEISAMPYVIRMADLSGVAAEGKVDDEKLKAAINRVLEAIPQLKKPVESAAGGLKVGAGTGSGGEGADDDSLWAAFNTRKI
ncbi:MAG: hypothetical protein ACI3W7_01940 [Oscillospiraceae bacterium]